MIKRGSSCISWGWEVACLPHLVLTLRSPGPDPKLCRKAWAWNTGQHQDWSDVGKKHKSKKHLPLQGVCRDALEAGPQSGREQSHQALHLQLQQDSSLFRDKNDHDKHKGRN